VDFSQRVSDLAQKSRHAASYAQTEEATKMAVVVPFIQMLGFDTSNLEEVIPEFVADVGIKKGEKIDFAIRVDGKLAILVEVKPITMSLGAAQYSQLYRYFGVSEARLAILTNGREFWFFSDIAEPNKLDKSPFFVFDVQSYHESQVSELARFQKSIFAIDAILEAASNLSRVSKVAGYLKKQLAQPDDDFVRMVGRQVETRNLTKPVIDELRQTVQAALDEVIRDRIQDKLGVTFAQEAPIKVVLPAEAAEALAEADEALDRSEVETTSDELMAFMIVRAIGSKTVPIERIAMRDAKSYCAVFMDDNNRKPICRFYFNAKSVKSIGLFDAEKAETRHQVSGPSDLYKYAGEIEAVVSAYA
jgi:hypothetical protein